MKLRNITNEWNLSYFHMVNKYFKKKPLHLQNVTKLMRCPRFF